MTKRELRKIYLEKRKSLSKTDIESYSKSIFKQFCSYFDLKNEKIHCFLPILSKNEINTTILIQTLFSDTNCTVITSKSDFESLEMSHYVINENTIFDEDKYGIPSPQSTKEISVKEIDVIIVPLLCFDKKGFRVGYGKGFYDRFISNCKPDVKTIGVSIFDPINSINDLNEFDKSLNHCITPTSIHHFKQ